MARRLAAIAIAMVLVAAAAVDRPVRAQIPTGVLQLADGSGPRFFAERPAGDPDAPLVDVRNAAVFRRQVVLALNGVTVAAAVDEIARRGNVQISFSPEALQATGMVSLSSSGITVGAALTAVLFDAGVDVQLARDGTNIALVPRRTSETVAAPARRRQGTGTITGHVTDGALKAPLSEVAIRVEGMPLSTVANADGKYTIAGVAPGAYRVTARRVGYQSLTKDVTVTADQSVTLDFAVVAAATRLDEIVTTAVGQQRRYEVGNTISTINADSITPTAPITSLTDLISARAPGVTVLETSGMTGAGEAIRIRGLSSLVLQNDPILIVDGVRQDNSAGGDISSVFPYSVGDHPTPTRLNDLDFNDIASIDILKGPAASTEYGTDAANGVIVVTMKHGNAGRPQWRASAEQTTSGIPMDFPEGYYSWGHLTDGTGTAVDCPLVGGGFNQYGSAPGSCVVDSVTQWNPLNHAATSIFGAGNRERYDLSVGGGTEAVRYFVSGGLTNETGIVRMPPVFRELADTAELGLPSAASNPNSEQQRSVRANTAIRLGPTADLAVTGSYLSTYQQTPDAEVLYEGVYEAPALSGPAHYYGYGFVQGSSSLTPLAELTNIGTQNTNRMTGGLTSNWRPSGWFVGHATVGLDHGSQASEALVYPLANTAYENVTPSLGLSDATTDVYSVDLRGTATAFLTHGLRAVTSAGLQMVDTRLAGQTAYTQNITATNLTLNGATGPGVTQLGSRQATLGGYGEEQLSVADRLFLTAALRIDAASGFGRAYTTATYPKASLSWLAVSTGATTVRLRGAFGASGVQPTNGASLQLFTPTVATNGAGGSLVVASDLAWPGDPTLRPERSEEFEGGIDVGGWGDRLSMEITGYAKTTHDALVNVNLGETFGNLTYQQNIGEVRNTGLEGNVSVALVQSRALAWTAAVNASLNHNTLVSLAPGVSAQTVSLYPSELRQAVGYPLYGIWAQHVAYADANRDGIIESSEVTLADSATYDGPSLPTQEVSLSSHLALWRGAVTINGLADYRGGYRVANAVGYTADRVGNPRQANDPVAPLWLQARAVVDAGTSDFNSLDVEDGSFIRVREISVTYAAPRLWVRALRLESLTVTGAVRNLALWTRYTGVDPEVSNAFGSNIQSAQTSGGAVANNDVREDFGTVPLARYWVVRLNLGL